MDAKRCSGAGVLWLAVLAASLGAAESGANDWPQWRGPTRNGVVPAQKWSWKWPKDGPKKHWSMNIGQGYASPILCDGRVYAFGRENGDWLRCIDAQVGSVLWKVKVGEGRDEFVTSTPCTDGKRVYAVTAAGDVAAIDTQNGNEIWKVNIVKEYRTSRGGFHGIANSPLLVGDVLVLAQGVGLDKNTGKLLWQNAEAMTRVHASPVSCPAEGQPGVLVFGRQLVRIDPASGKIIWQEDKIRNLGGYMDPIVNGDELLIIGGGGLRFKVTHSTITEDTKDIVRGSTHGYFGAGDMANPVHWQGYLYSPRHGSGDRSGMFGDNPDLSMSSLRCYDMKTLKNMWTAEGLSGTPVVCDGKIIFLGQWGELRVIEASPAGYKELANARVFAPSSGSPVNPFGRASFSTPILANGKIYCRFYLGELVCLDVSQDAPDADQKGERERIVGELYSVTGTVSTKDAAMPDHVVALLSEDAKSKGQPKVLKLCARKHNDSPGHLEKIAGFVANKARVTVTGTLLYDDQISVNRIEAVEASSGPKPNP